MVFSSERAFDLFGCKNLCAARVEMLLALSRDFVGKVRDADSAYPSIACILRNQSNSVGFFICSYVFNATNLGNVWTNLVPCAPPIWVIFARVEHDNEVGCLAFGHICETVW
jgi:hypothetical protein